MKHQMLAPPPNHAAVLEPAKPLFMKPSVNFVWRTRSRIGRLGGGRARSHSLLQLGSRTILAAA
jgi:hypothetical protein